MQFVLTIVGLVLYFVFTLLPYYVAYKIIEPESFIGTVGVFVLGSVVVPVTTMIVMIFMGFMARIFGTK